MSVHPAAASARVAIRRAHGRESRSVPRRRLPVPRLPRLTGRKVARRRGAVRRSRDAFSSRAATSRRSATTPAHLPRYGLVPSPCRLTCRDVWRACRDVRRSCREAGSTAGPALIARCRSCSALTSRRPLPFSAGVTPRSRCYLYCIRLVREPLAGRPPSPKVVGSADRALDTRVSIALPTTMV